MAQRYGNDFNSSEDENLYPPHLKKKSYSKDSFSDYSNNSDSFLSGKSKTC